MPPIFPLAINTEGSKGEKKPEREPRNLVLFFDGTGNEFIGSDKDTNVVKLLNMMDRNACNQYHYYQSTLIISQSRLVAYMLLAGIGTYDVKEKTVHKSSLGGMKSSFWKMVDQGFGTTFDAHVIAGYRFLMQYYSPVSKPSPLSWRAFQLTFHDDRVIEFTCSGSVAGHTPLDFSHAWFSLLDFSAKGTRRWCLSHIASTSGT